MALPFPIILFLSAPLLMLALILNNIFGFGTGGRRIVFIHLPLHLLFLRLNPATVPTLHPVHPVVAELVWPPGISPPRPAHLDHLDTRSGVPDFLCNRLQMSAHVAPQLVIETTPPIRRSRIAVDDDRAEGCEPTGCWLLCGHIICRPICGDVDPEVPAEVGGKLTYGEVEAQVGKAEMSERGRSMAGEVVQDTGQVEPLHADAV